MSAKDAHDVVAIQQITSWSGPLPNPEHLKEAKLGMVIAGVGLANIAATFIGRKSSSK